MTDTPKPPEPYGCPYGGMFRQDAEKEAAALGRELLEAKDALDLIEPIAARAEQAERQLAEWGWNLARIVELQKAMARIEKLTEGGEGADDFERALDAIHEIVGEELAGGWEPPVAEDKAGKEELGQYKIGGTMGDYQAELRNAYAAGHLSGGIVGREGWERPGEFDAWLAQPCTCGTDSFCERHPRRPQSRP